MPASAPKNRPPTPRWPEIPDRSVKPKLASQDPDLSDEFEPENLSQKTKLHFERVNEATFKLTDGESTNVPASHGQWGGYRTTKAVASVINVAPGQWLARCRDEASAPSSFNEAKADALANGEGRSWRLLHRESNRPPQRSASAIGRSPTQQ
jgi:hypothetical protein